MAEASAADDGGTTVVSSCGHARFSFLTPAIVRLEWSPSGGQFVDLPSLHFTQRSAGNPGTVALSRAADTGELCMESAALLLTFKDGPDAAHSPWDERLCITVKGTDAVWLPGQVDTGNLEGTCRTLDNISGATALQPGLLSKDGWVVVDDSTTPLLDRAVPGHAHLRGAASGAGAATGGITGDGSPPGEYWKHQPWPKARPTDPAGATKDWYFFGHGRNYKQALFEFTQIAGKVPLPPRWAFGAWWSRYWPYTEAEFKELIHEFREHDVPVDVLVIDMDWHKDGWTGYSWNPTYFTDAPKFLEWCHGEGLSVTLNLHPADGVAPHEDAYKDVCAVTETPVGATVPCDVLNKRYMDAYFRCLHHPLEKQGVDFWWIDWQQGSQSSLPGLDPLFWLNHLHWVDMERNATRGGRRPLLLSRWGGLGNHRYQIGFSGDTHSNWKSLTFQVGMTAKSGNVAYPYWSHDIGGHFPGAVEPELFVRWVQWAAFNPFLRTHSTRSVSGERRIWKLPDRYFKAARAAFHLRYSLMSYIYTTARATYDTGLPLNRPLYYDWPDVEEAYGHDGCYMFGDNLLCAPITSAVDETSGLATVNVWFPPGVWYNWCTGRRYSGPGASLVAAPLEEVPVFAKAGSVTPVDPKKAYSRQDSRDPLSLHVFPGGGGSFTLYEDDGDSQAYQDAVAVPGAGVRTEFASTCDGDVSTVTVQPASGLPSGAARTRNLRLVFRESWPAARVTVNGTGVPVTADAVYPACWYDRDQVSMVVAVAVDQTAVTTVTVTAPRSDVALLSAGLKGRLAALHRVATALGDATPPDVEDLQETVSALYLSCAVVPAEAGAGAGAGGEVVAADDSGLAAGLAALFQDKWMSVCAATMLATTRFGGALPNRQALGLQLMATACADMVGMVYRADPDVCRCKDPESGAFLAVAAADRYWAKWRKATGGHLAPADPTADPPRWDEYDDAGTKFASFQEMSRSGNCRKCMTLVIFDASRGMYVRATPDEFAWSMDQVQWNTIASGKWTPT